MSNKTVLHAKHLEAGAKMVDFYGWDMPINYGSQIEEHHAVRQEAGMFDVSHMTIVDVDVHLNKTLTLMRNVQKLYLIFTPIKTQIRHKQYIFLFVASADLTAPARPYLRESSS